MPKINIEKRYMEIELLDADRDIDSKIIARKDIKLINFLLIAITVIAIPPSRAPIPSKDVNIPIQKSFGLNFSISNRLINAMNGRAKILKTKVRDITDNKLTLSLVCPITFRSDWVQLFVLVVKVSPFWVETKKTDRAYSCLLYTSDAADES